MPSLLLSVVLIEKALSFFRNFAHYMIPIKISVLFFGQITEYTHVPGLELYDMVDTDSVINHLKSLFPSLKVSPYQIALDKEIIHENTPLHSNHTLALLPPYAGG